MRCITRWDNILGLKVMCLRYIILNTIKKYLLKTVIHISGIQNRQNLIACQKYIQDKTKSY